MKDAARRIHTGNRIADDAQENGRRSILRQNAAVFDGGVLLNAESGAPANSGLVFAAGVTRSLAHGLGRAAKGWTETYHPDVPSSAHVGLFTAANPAPLTSSTHITVTPTNSGTCLIFVY